MKILLIGPFPKPINGCSYANQILSQNLGKEGIHFEIINTSTPSISSKQGNSFSIKKALSFLRTYLSFYKIFRSQKVYFTPGQTFFGLMKYAPFIFTCLILKKPYFMHLHGNYLGTQFLLLKGIKKKIFKFLISKSSGGIVLSKSLKDNFKDILPERKIHVVENFVENSLFQYTEGKNKDFSKTKILYFSNLMKEKGILELLDALLLLQSKGHNFEVTLAGAIEKEIEEEVNDKIKLLGPTTKYIGVIEGNVKHRVLFESNVFVLPTYYKMEGQPISILEALAAGNIIVTTKQGGISDIISNENGFFVEKKLPESIENIILRINSEPLENKVSMSKLNIHYAQESFTEKKFTEKILDILNN